jgi:hypothetical protein
VSRTMPATGPCGMNSKRVPGQMDKPVQGAGRGTAVSWLPGQRSVAYRA